MRLEVWTCAVLEALSGWHQPTCWWVETVTEKSPDVGVYV